MRRRGLGRQGSSKRCGIGTGCGAGDICDRRENFGGFLRRDAGRGWDRRARCGNRCKRCNCAR